MDELKAASRAPQAGECDGGARPQDGKVDMVALARETALADAMLSRPGMRKLIAPAKVNLHLAIGARRENGYHDAENVLHAVMLHDTVYVRSVPAAPGAGLDVAVVCMGKDGVEAPVLAPEDNIVYRATKLLAGNLGRTADETVEIVVEKRIPHQAGLGGGSSDAAAVLVGLADIWGCSIDDSAVVDAAKALGVDVAFFLKGGCALFDGTGENYVASFAPRKDSIVIVKPEGGLSTAAVYKEFDAVPGSIDAAASARIRAVADARDIELSNDLAAPAERLAPELGRIRTWLEEQPGVEKALLCGSGSSTFAVCTSFSDACAVASAAQARGLWARATSFSNVRACKIPS